MTTTLLNNVLSRLLAEWNILNKSQQPQSELNKQQIMDDIRIIYDEASSMINECPALFDFCSNAYETILCLDPLEAQLHFTTHQTTNHEPA